MWSKVPAGIAVIVLVTALVAGALIAGKALGVSSTAGPSPVHESVATR